MRVSKRTKQRVRNRSYTNRKNAQDEAYRERKMSRAKQSSLDKQREFELKKQQAKSASNVGVATAVSAGATSLGRGLSDENNQDLDKRNADLQATIGAILNSDRRPIDPETDTTALKEATI